MLPSLRVALGVGLPKLDFTELGVPGLVDDPHAATAQFFEDLVVG